MIRPSSRLVVAVPIVLLLAIALGTLRAFGTLDAAALETASWSALAVLALIALGDALAVRRLPSPDVQRELPPRLTLARWHDVHLTVRALGATRVPVTLFDHPPASLAFEGLPQALTLQPDCQARLSYRVRPRQRGPLGFEHCDLQLTSPLGLWLHRRRVALTGQSRVYPDYAHLPGQGLLAADQSLGRLGIRQQPRRGQGLEFHQLRDLRDGDSLRQVEWKATARHGRPIVRDFQEERDQQVILLLDCGRRMRSQDDELSHFDHALNACLLLSHIALRQGDAVGLLTFASDPVHFIPPRKGHAQFNTLLHALHDLDTTRQHADFSDAARQLLKRQPRRALVVLITNVGNEDDEQLLTAVQQLGRHHRVLVASLREGVLETLRQAPVQTFDQALDYCGAIDWLGARDAHHDGLSAQGIALIDTPPTALGAGLINRYLGWKKAGLL